MSQTDLSHLDGHASILAPAAAAHAHAYDDGGGPGLDLGRTPLRIMVAEDNGALRRLLALVLRRDGHDVAEACDASELLEALASSLIDGGDAPIDLVICEHSLPGIAGLSVLAGLRSRDRVTPFILMTGDEEVQQKARRLGAVVLDHPFNVAAIRGAVRESAALAQLASF
jgi:two-component system, OmpR family, response regulator